MKTLKFLPFLLFLSLIGSSLSAQLSFKVGVGPQLSNFNNYLIEYDSYLGFNADFRMVFRSDKKLQIELGLGYNQKGTRYNLFAADLRWPSQHDGSGGFDPSLPAGEANVASYHFKTRTSFIELPTQVSFFFKEPADGFYALGSLRPSLGFAYQRIYEQRDASGNEIKKEKRTLSKADQPKNFNVISRAGIGFEKASEASLNYFVEVYAEAQLLDLATENSTNVKFYQYGFGALLGIRF